jgi:hypothetical protein
VGGLLRNSRGTDPEVPVLDAIGVIPLHPLLVHAVVVLVPLAVLPVLGSALSRRFRALAGILTPIAATPALVSVPLATESGESLEHRVDQTALVEAHAEMGEGLLVVVAVLAVAAWALWFLDRRARAAGHTGRSALMLVVVVAVLAVAGTVVQTVRIGHSGGKATWSETGQVTPTGGEGGGDGD